MISIDDELPPSNVWIYTSRAESEPFDNPEYMGKMMFECPAHEIERHMREVGYLHWDYCD